MPVQGSGSCRKPARKWVGSTARVRGVMARSIAAGDSVNVTGSMSANTGVRPATRAISGATQKVKAGTMISEPGGKSIDLRMK